MRAFILSIVLALFLAFSSGFNFETRLPIVKKGGDDSYFGFSVAEHQVEDQPLNKQTLDNSWILVGAPLDQNKQPNTSHSGALWKCPLTTRHSDCEQVITDGVKDVDSLDLIPPADDEIKNNQWLGVTVRSEGKGKTILVCAHRYIKKGKDYRFGRGLCYTLSSDFSKFNKPIDPCQGRPTERAHEQYAYCQAGTSGHMYEGIAVIGSPGTYTWRGTVFAQEVAGDFLYRDKFVYLTPHVDNVSPVDKYSYLGMSVTAGNFFGDGVVAIAAGAPRSNGTGQVVLFSQAKFKVVLFTNLTLSGEVITSNFGYELCTADVNGDGLDDLIVGAPNYFDKDHGGAVYVYVNHKASCSLECEKPIKIRGEPESRFGISIARLGDINKDGYDDIAVGAPYQGNGVIYIYLGSKNGTLTDPSQVISGDRYDVRTFGYSLSGGLDLDNNGYPDLLTGAFESNAVILLRGRPIIEIKTAVEPDSNLRNIDPTLRQCSLQGLKLACFKFSACVSVSGIGSERILRTVSNLKLNCTLQADIRRRFARVFIGEDIKSKPPTLHRVISLIKNPTTNEFKTCQEHIVYIKEDTKDIQSAIALRLSYSLIQNEPPVVRPGNSLPTVDDYPILNMQQADKIFHATFLKDCGHNDICESQLHINAALQLPKSRAPGGMWDLVLGEYEEVILDTTVQNLKESAYESYLVIAHSPSLSYVAQQGNTATCTRVNETLVVCALGNPLENNAAVTVVLRFEPLASIDEVSEVHFNLSANTTSTLVDTQSDIQLTASIVRKAGLKLKGSTRQEEVLYGGTVRGESEMKYKDQPGTRLRHTYEIVNHGPWHVNNLEIHIDWPFQVANNKARGKWLLYMDEEPTVEAEEGGVCSTSPDLVNPLRLKDRNTLRSLAGGNHTRSRIRRKRDEEMVVRKDSDNVVRMNCKNMTAKCVRFHCVIYKLLTKQSAVVTVISRLWNSTLVEDYSNVKSVEIASNAKLYVQTPGVVITSNSSDIEAQIVTVARGGFLEQQAAEGVEWWMILVGVVAGILLLLVCILLLWKCGFFKRTRPDPTLSGNLEKHTVDDYHDY